MSLSAVPVEEHPLIHSASEQNQESSSHTTQNEVYQCNICWESRSADQMRTNSCGHTFCSECIQTLVEGYTKAQRPCPTILCPSPGCTSLSDQDVESACRAELYQEYIKLKELSQRLQKEDPNIWICPSQNCGRIYNLEGLSSESISCHGCKKTWCVCKTEPHPGKTCLMNKFEKHLRDPVDEIGYIWWRVDSLARNLVKDCPSCGIEIEKSAGCNHMTCSSCRYEFCWVCLQMYTIYHFDSGLCVGKRYATVPTFKEKLAYGAKVGGVTVGAVLLLPFALLAVPFIATYHALS